MLQRREFLTRAAGGVLAGSFLASPKWLMAQEKKQPELDWHDVQEWGVEGKGWNDTLRYFDRFPAKAEKTVRPPVWNLSRHSAGMLVHFKTDAPSIWAHYKVMSDRLGMPHMPATGVSGVDLYAAREDGKMSWLGVTRPNKQEMQVQIVGGILPGERLYSAYLPLYNGTDFLKIGVPKGAKFTPVEPRQEKPLLFYGTSITHGACASRPGMAHPSIVGRRLNRPIINLGFSGNGRMEAEVGELLTELDPAVYILDCLPNMTHDLIAERAEPLVKQLRKARPETPILMVEDRTYSGSLFLPSQQTRNHESRAAFRKVYESLKGSGVSGLHYLDGELLLGEDRDDTTDGSHPSDLGFYRHAEAFEPVLRKILSPPQA